MMRYALFFCSGHTAGSTAVCGSRAARLATAPGAHSRRLRKESPEFSACRSKRGRPWHTPAPVTHLAIGAFKCPCHAALQNRCSK
eukprot:4686260-Pyramimonas_sp.AAC.1